MAQRRLVPIVLNMDDSQPRAKIKSLEDSLYKLDKRSNAPSRPRLTNPFSNPQVDRHLMRAANEIMRINNQTMRLSMQNDRLLERAARQLADVRIRESKRSADAMLRSLNEGRRGVATATKDIGGSFGSIFGGSFLGNMAGNAMSRVVGAVRSGVEEIISEGIRLASETQNALKGLSSVAAFKGISDEEAQRAVLNLRFVKGGIIEVSDASTGLKNLLATGFSLPESINLMERFSDASAFGKQAALGYGQAIRGATEGIRNQNSLLVDNVGITKNLSVILKEYGFKLEDLQSKTKGAAARQALYNGLLAESTAQVGDADKLMADYTGTIAAQDIAYQNLVRALGMIIINSPRLIESSKIVTEQINGQTEALRDAGSESHRFAQSTVDDFAFIKSHAIPFIASLFHMVNIIGDGIGLVVGGVVTGVTWMVGAVINAVNDTVNGILGGLKIINNGIHSFAESLGLGMLGPGRLDLTPTFRTDLDPSAGMRQELSRIVADIKASHAAMKMLSAEGAMIDRRLERAPRDASFMRSLTQRGALGGDHRLTRANELAGGGSPDTGGKSGQRKAEQKIIDDADKWRVSEIREIQEWFKLQTGRTLPVSVMGQSRFHNLKGLDHRNAADVALHPNSREGRMLIDYLKANDIPHRGLTEADKARGVIMTNPHIHIGDTSSGFGKKTKSLAVTRGGRDDDSVLMKINDQVVRVLPEQIYKFQSQVAALREKAFPKDAAIETTGDVAGVEKLTRQLSTFEQARKAIDDQLGEQALELFNRQKNFALELGDVWRQAALERAFREMDLMKSLEESEAHLYNLRAENSDVHMINLRRENMTRREQLELTHTLSDLEDERATMGANAALRYRVEWQRAINDVQRADIEARASMIRSQVQIADKTIYHADQANARVMEFMAAQKGMTDIVAEAKIGVFQQTFNLIDTGLDRIIPKLGGVGDLLKQIIADLLKLAASKQLAKVFGLGTGESSTQASSGGFDIFGTIKNLLGFGRKGGVASPLTGGFAGGASPAASIFSAATTGAASLFSGATTAATAAPLSLAVAPGAAIASVFGAGSAAGLFGGGGAAASTGAAASGGGLSMGSLAAFASNPITLAVAGAAIGGFMLWRHFRNGTEKKLRAAIRQSYGVDIKDMATLKQIKQLGEQAFGKGNVGKNLMGTIRLDSVKELISNYAESTGQQGIGLTSNKEYGDPTFRENQFVRGESSDMDSIKAARASVPAASTSGESSGSSSAVMSRYSSQAQGGGVNGMVGAAIVGVLGKIMEVQDKLEKKIGAASAGQVVTWAKDQNPEAFVDGFNEAMSRGHRKDETLTNLGFRNG